MELDLWAGFLARRDIRVLPAEQRLCLIEIAVAAATIEDLDIPDGFVPDVVIQFLDWPLDRVANFLSDFVQRGWMTRFDDPPGWQINGWLEKVTHFTPGSKETAVPAWGQKRRSAVLTRRLASRERQVRYRDKQRFKDSPSASPTPD
jgi:hypothetical protein